jgi:hypothetical protein
MRFHRSIHTSYIVDVVSTGVREPSNVARFDRNPIPTRERTNERTRTRTRPHTYLDRHLEPSLILHPEFHPSERSFTERALERVLTDAGDFFTHDV